MAANQLANQGKTGRHTGVVPLPSSRAQVATSAAQTLAQLAGFPVMDLSRQVALYGSDQAVEPPDTQLAAGTTYLVEADNSALSVWTKSGALVMTRDLNAFFTVPAGYSFADPRILYDSESSRWFLSGFALNVANDSQMLIAVSTTSDPTASWATYVLGSGTGLFGDQPMIGLNSDKVVLSWNDFSGTPPAAPIFSGQETWVLQKSDLVSGVGVHISAFGPDTARYRVVPAQSLTPSTTEWLSYNNADCALACNAGSPTVGVVAINGTPLMGNVTWTETDPALAPTTAPPSPRQPSGMPVTQEIDDRFLSAVWQSGRLWVSGNNGCFPAGDFTTRSCMRLIEISTGGTPTVAQDIDAGQNGVDLSYPAVTVNSSGDLFIGYSASSPTLYPSALAVDSLAASPVTFENPVTLASGLTSYMGGTTSRWGDYSAAAPDPSNPSDVWVTAEYQASATIAGNWGTATGRLAIQPSITALSPDFGPPAGGTSVTITGSHFQSGAAVSFGSNAATNVAVISGLQITATTPAASAVAPVDVTVSNADGTIGTAPAAYTYTVSPRVTSVAPNQGSPAGGTSVTITGGNFTAVSAVTFGATAAASITFISDSQITAVSPAHVAGLIDIIVTTPAGTSATSPSDQFTYLLLSSYFQWFDRASPGMVNDNIHLLNTSGATANVMVTLPGASGINVSLAAGAETYVSFGPGHIGGPVVVNSDQQVLAAQRVQYYQTFNEVWAGSASQAATTSYFNWFDKASPGMFNDNIHLLNPGGTSASVTVSLPGAASQVATVAPGAEALVTFPAGSIGGPVTVSSTQPVLASQRVQYYQSFNEVWASSAAQAATTSYLNWFDKASPGMFNDNIHLLNPGSASATVTVSLPGATSQVTTVAPGAEANVTFPAGKIGGPVTVSATQPVLASQRVQYYQSFNEVWAVTAGQAVTTSYFNWFDKASPGMFNDNIHLLNPGSASATVTVSLPGAASQVATVGPGAEALVTFPAGSIGGPVTVSSTQPVLASQRVQYYQSFNEVSAG
jgi:hypothetical protein